jgi:hypothetical protein
LLKAERPRGPARSGRHSIDHAPGGRDDLANAGAGMLVGIDLGAGDVLEQAFGERVVAFLEHKRRGSQPAHAVALYRNQNRSRHCIRWVIVKIFPG